VLDARTGGGPIIRITPDQWPTLSSLLDEAFDLPLAARDNWLAQLAPAHLPFRPVLRDLLAKHAAVETDDFLDTLPKFTAAGNDLHRTTPAGFESGAIIGPYQLVRELGRGGMGEVWLAIRNDGALNRPVALKLPHAHLLSGALRQRFERERDILAALSHPHIAPLYDAGVSEGGHPYLAMECIDGVPIAAYCSQVRQPIAARLDLFKQVLDAVRYAHERFIAHRDLKPSNILVTPDGQVKLLDFGIAKLLSGDTSGAPTELTQLGGRVATPDYAAPEQIAGQPITTAVDLYALGVVLFELLTGARPFKAARGVNALSSNAPLASQRVAEAEADLIGGIKAAQLRKALQGDLDAIIAKALESDPAQRYRSAAAFAEDVQRYQCHEPISARHIGRLMLARKFERSHRLASALTAGLVAALLVGTAGIGWEALRAQREAHRAHDEAQRAESEATRQKATKDFLIGVFRASDPRIASDKPRGTITAKELLDVSSDKIEKQFANDPQTEIELLGLTADIYGELDENERFGILNQKQIDRARLLYGDSSAVVVEALLKKADDANTRGDYAEALKELERIDGLIKRGGLEGSVQRAYSFFIRGIALTPDASSQPERLRAFEQASAIYSAIAPHDPRYSFVLSSIGGIYHGRSDYRRAAEYTKQSIAVAESVPDRDDGALSLNYSNLGKDLSYDGDFEGAVRAYEHAAQLAKDTYGIHSASYWTVAGNYAQTLHLRGDRERSMEMFNALMEVLPPESAKYHNALEQNSAARVRETYGQCLLAEGRPRLALREFEAAERGYREAPTYFYDLSIAQGEIGAASDHLGRVTLAKRLLKIGLDEYVKAFPPDNPGVLRQRLVWGTFELEHSDPDGAEKQFREILSQGHDRKLAPIALAYGGLARLAISRHDPAAALSASSRAIDVFDNLTGPRDVRMGPKLWRIRAEGLLESGDAQAALQLAQRALDADRRYDDPSSPDIAEAEATLSAAKAAITASGKQP
jgi:tetratricopeptide (TPR) repeat protein